MYAVSLGVGRVSEYVGAQLKQLYAPLVDSKRKKLNVAIHQCPAQTNGSDCGVYATAVAFQWATRGTENLPLEWGLSAAMRQHLVACLEGSQIALFPQPQSNARSSRKCRKKRSAKISRDWV